MLSSSTSAGGPQSFSLSCTYQGCYWFSHDSHCDPAIFAPESSSITLLEMTMLSNPTQLPQMPSRKRSANSQRWNQKPIRGFASVPSSLPSLSWPSLPSSLWRVSSLCVRREQLPRSAFSVQRCRREVLLINVFQMVRPHTFASHQFCCRWGCCDGMRTLSLTKIYPILTLLLRFSSCEAVCSTFWASLRFLPNWQKLAQSI